MSLVDAIHLALLVLVVIAGFAILQRVVYRWERQRAWRRETRKSGQVPLKW